MKIKKLLIPTLGITGAAIACTPLICLTSCGDNKVEKDYFVLNTRLSSKKQIEIKKDEKSSWVQFELRYIFDGNPEFEALPEKEQKVTATIDFASKGTSEYSYIKFTQCYGSYDKDQNSIEVHIDVTVLQSYWERTKLDKDEDPKAKFNIQLSGDNWYKNYTDFSISLEKPSGN